jgi:hypothetical protein
MVIGPPGGHLVPGPPWFGYAHDPQHSAQSSVQIQAVTRVHWRTPVDLAPVHAGNGDLLAHYGSPIVTNGDILLIPVKTTADNFFRIEAHNAGSGALIWKFPSDYTLPAHDWVPSFNPSLTVGNRLYFPGSGGKLFYRDDPDGTKNPVQNVVFYGAAQYAQNKAIYDRDVIIDTPVSTDAQGNAYFGFIVNGAVPNGLTSGIARVSPTGTGTWVSVTSASGDGSMTQVAMNCAPALSLDGSTLYLAVSNATNGYLLALDSTTLATKGKVFLTDPYSGQPSWISNDSTASPTVGPDGDVYYGVLESPFPDHNDRGWLLHFDATLSKQKISGSFGWDDTVSIVPSTMVPSYAGMSTYLLMTKYNNYANACYMSVCGDGMNRIAILDPNATEPDPILGNPVMNEVLTILGVTPNPDLPGVREWCINTAAVDPATDSVLANSEDGYLYRWDLSTNTFTSRVQLTGGIGESYTPTSIGPDGQVYAINNAVLFAIGQ